MSADTTRMSTRSHHPIGGRLRKEVIHVMADGEWLMADGHVPYCFGRPHDLDHLSDGVHPDDVRAKKNGRCDGRRRRPVAFGSRTVAGGFTKEGFARGADDER